MTVAEMISEFRTTYDLGSLGLPGFEDDEIRVFLNKAQYRIIEQQFDNFDALSRLMVRATEGTSTTTRGYRLIILPTNYLHMKDLVVQHTEGDERAIRINYNQEARFQSSYRNKKAYIKNPVYLMDNTSGEPAVRLYVDSHYDGANPDVMMLYIKIPSDLTMVDSPDDFNVDIYHDIIRVAVDDAIFTVSPNKSQLSSQHLNK